MQGGWSQSAPLAAGPPLADRLVVGAGLYCRPASRARGEAARGLLGCPCRRTARKPNRRRRSRPDWGWEEPDCAARTAGGGAGRSGRRGLGARGRACLSLGIPTRTDTNPIRCNANFSNFLFISRVEGSVHLFPSNCRGWALFRFGLLALQKKILYTVIVKRENSLFDTTLLIPLLTLES